MLFNVNNLTLFCLERKWKTFLETLPRCVLYRIWNWFYFISLLVGMFYISNLFDDHVLSNINIERVSNLMIAKKMFLKYILFFHKVLVFRRFCLNLLIQSEFCVASKEMVEFEQQRVKNSQNWNYHNKACMGYFNAYKYICNMFKNVKLVIQCNCLSMI